MKTQILEIKTGSRPIEQIIDVVQGDSGRVLRCIISDMSIPEGSIARYYGKKPSGMQIYNDCNIDGNVAVLEITTQMTAEIGILYGQIEVTNNNKTVTSFCFSIRINKNIKSSDAIESTNEFTALENALQKAEGLTDPIITFSEATERKNLISGSKLSIIIGNISRWLKDLKTAAFMYVANNDTTTEEGYVADARAVKALGEEIDELNTNMELVDFTSQCTITGAVVSVDNAYKIGKLCIINAVISKDIGSSWIDSNAHGIISPYLPVKNIQVIDGITTSGADSSKRMRLKYRTDGKFSGIVTEEFNGNQEIQLIYFTK